MCRVRVDGGGLLTRLRADACPELDQARTEFLMGRPSEFETGVGRERWVRDNLRAERNRASAAASGERSATARTPGMLLELVVLRRRSRLARDCRRFAGAAAPAEVGDERLNIRVAQIDVVLALQQEVGSLMDRCTIRSVMSRSMAPWRSPRIGADEASGDGYGLGSIKRNSETSIAVPLVMPMTQPRSCVAPHKRNVETNESRRRPTISRVVLSSLTIHAREAMPV